VAALPALEEQLQRYADAGLEGKLLEGTSLIKEGEVFREFDRRMRTVDEAAGRLEKVVPLSSSFARSPATNGLPFSKELSGLGDAVDGVSATMSAAMRSVRASLEAAKATADAIRLSWNARKEEVERSSAPALRELLVIRTDCTRLSPPLQNLIDELNKDGVTVTVDRMRWSPPAGSWWLATPSDL